MAQLTSNGPSEPPRGLAVDITEDERRRDTQELKRSDSWSRFIVSCVIGFLLPIVYHTIVEHVRGIFVVHLASKQYYCMLFFLGVSGMALTHRLLK